MLTLLDHHNLLCRNGYRHAHCYCSFLLSPSSLSSNPIAGVQIPPAFLLLLCLRQASYDQHPSLLLCSTRVAPRTLTLTVDHTSSRRQPFETRLRISEVKVCVKKWAQYTGNHPDKGSAVTSRDTTAAENEIHWSGHTYRNSMRLTKMSVAKQAGGKEETEKDKQPVA
jgi:hypothetical protein